MANGWKNNLVLFLCAPVFAGASPLVAGLEGSQLEPTLRGQVLFEELGCVSCHRANDNLTKASKKAPRLGKISARVNPDYLRQFIQHPQELKPGTTMPEVMHGLPEAEREQAAEAITHFLMSLHDKDPFAPTAPDHVYAEFGREVFHQRGCVACHSPRDEQGEELLKAESVPVGALEKKYSYRSLVQFLRRPHDVRPSGRMPDMRLEGREVEQVAHYLLRKARVPGHLKVTRWRGQVWEGLDSAEVQKEQGGQIKDFELNSFKQVPHNSAIRYQGFIKADTAGEFSFFVEMNGGTLNVSGVDVISEDPSNRRGVKKVQGKVHLKETWQPIRFDYFHTGREPRLKLEIAGPGLPRGVVPSDMLSVSDVEIPTFVPWPVDPDRIEEGKAYFGQLGCARCHDDVRAEAASGPSLSDLNPAKGCLSEKPGAWPQYHLSKAQRSHLRDALPQLGGNALSAAQQLDKTLVTFNCIACHERAGLGGVSPQRNKYFTGSKPELGNQGRIAPPLTHVGAKLTPGYLREVLLQGHRQRGYVDAQMPLFGEAQVGHLVELFATVDTLEQVDIPEAKDLKAAGHQLMGTEGLSCIACHDFNGQKAAGPGALELVNTTERLQKNWFHLYMRNPSRFHPQVIMPSYWPGGVAVRKDVLNGDSAGQIEALWQYLEDGKRAKNPAGLSRQSEELRVTDVAVMCRGRGPAGYRGIAVGYPKGVSLAFDSEQMSVRQFWKGDFANARPNSWSPRGGERITFPPGIPFHRFQSMDAHWPYKGKTDYLFPHDQGYQYRGYTLDQQKRPTFVYHYGEMKVEDFFEDRLDADGKAYLKRTLRFEAEYKQKMFHFRVASGKNVRKEGAGYNVDKLSIEIEPAQESLVREGDPAELLLELKIPAGKSELVLEYRW